MNNLFFDDRCPLCLKTVRFISKNIVISGLNYVPLSDSRLDYHDKVKAYDHMLLISSHGLKYWGYNTYVKLFSISDSFFSPFFKVLSLLMKLPVVSSFGKYVYSVISSNRKRCDDSCLI